MEYHLIEDIRDEEKFRVITSKAPSGSRFQWAVSFEVDYLNVGETMPVTLLNHLLYELVETSD